MFKGVLATDLDETDVGGAVPFTVGDPTQGAQPLISASPPMQPVETTGVRWVLTLALALGGMALFSLKPGASDPPARQRQEDPSVPRDAMAAAQSSAPAPVVLRKKEAGAAAKPAARGLKASTPGKDVAESSVSGSHVDQTTDRSDGVASEPTNPEQGSPSTQSRQSPPDLQLLRQWQQRM